MSKINIIREVTFTANLTAPQASIPDVFSAEWFTRRVIVYPPGSGTPPGPSTGPPKSDDLTVGGVIYTFDPDIAEVLAELTPFGRNPAVEPSLFPTLYIKYTLAEIGSDVGETFKTKRFRPVIFCVPPGAQMTTLESETDKADHPLFSIPFVLAMPTNGRITDYLVTLSA